MVAIGVKDGKMTDISLVFCEADEKARTILVSCDNQKMLDELEEFTRACDVAVVGQVLQRRSKTYP